MTLKGKVAIITGGGGGIVMPPSPEGLQGGGALGNPGEGPAGAPGGAATPAMAGNASGIGKGFAPPASYERRQGMPTASSVDKTLSDDLTQEENDATLGPVRSRVENENETIHALPKAKNKKSYSFVTEELIEDSVNEKPLEERTIEQIKEANDKSAGPISE